MKEDFIQAENLREAMHSEIKNEKRSIFETCQKQRPQSIIFQTTQSNNHSSIDLKNAEP